MTMLLPSSRLIFWGIPKPASPSSIHRRRYSNSPSEPTASARLFGHSVSANNLVIVDQGNGNTAVQCASISGGATGFNDLADFEPVIDVKPGSDPSCFNIDGRGVVPVAVLGSLELDVSTIDVWEGRPLRSGPLDGRRPFERLGVP